MTWLHFLAKTQTRVGSGNSLGRSRVRCLWRPHEQNIYSKELREISSDHHHYHHQYLYWFALARICQVFSLVSCRTTWEWHLVTWPQATTTKYHQRTKNHQTTTTLVTPPPQIPKLCYLLCTRVNFKIKFFPWALKGHYRCLLESVLRAPALDFVFF